MHRAAHILTNADHLSSTEVQRQYEELLEEMRATVPLTTPLSQVTATFLKATESYWPGLFHCYDVVDLPRTNNDLEHVFGSTRYHERRRRVGNMPLLVSLCAAKCVSLQQLPPRITTLVALIWHLAIWRSGEHSESKLTIGMKLGVNTLVFGKTQSATYVL